MRRENAAHVYQSLNTPDFTFVERKNENVEENLNIA